jgi:predicted N-formylglutamate amidohydrolase
MAMSADAAQTDAGGRVLGPDDPPPFEILGPDGAARFLLVCDHASNVVPSALDDLGLDETALGRHIAVDIGAGEMTRRLSARLDATAVVAAYSRLVIDNNRYLDDPTSIPEISDGTIVPGNRDLAEADRQARVDQLFQPYHDAIAAELKALGWGDGAIPALISVHSFTPFFKGVERPWHVGLLWNRDRRIAAPLLEALSANRGVIVGENVPYSARDPYGYTVAEHADIHHLPNILIEIRQDLIDTHHGVETWVGILGDALTRVLAEDGLYRTESEP